MQILRYNKHLSGANSSPTCAIFALQPCAKHFKDDFLEASRVVLSSFYMDDLLVSVEIVERNKALSSETQTLLMKGSFNLNKWASNDSNVIKGQKLAEKNPTVLGLEWVRKRDELKVERLSWHLVQKSTTMDTERSVIKSV